jgi:hypothetical protein
MNYNLKGTKESIINGKHFEYFLCSEYVGPHQINTPNHQYD